MSPKGKKETPSKSKAAQPKKDAKPKAKTKESKANVVESDASGDTGLK